MSKQILLNVSLTIYEGKLNEFQTIAQEMVDASRKEPGTLGYEWYLSDDGKRCRLAETYVDANALLAHFAGPAVQEGVPKMLATANVSGFEVYGDPGPKAKEILGGFGAEIFSYWHGLGQ
ncbi:MAG: putative quinol monooxygenase [Candidatus Sulfotelmatobacter sp.]|jgi:quinol monooxygenase YgiN